MSLFWKASDHDASMWITRYGSRPSPGRLDKNDQNRRVGKAKACPPSSVSNGNIWWALCKKREAYAGGRHPRVERRSLLLREFPCELVDPRFALPWPNAVTVIWYQWLPLGGAWWRIVRQSATWHARLPLVGHRPSTMVVARDLKINHAAELHCGCPRHTIQRKHWRT